LRRESAWPVVLDPRDPFDDPHVVAGEHVRWRHDRRPLERAARIPTTEELLRVATDIAVGAGAEGPDRVLGPWADELDANVPAHRLALRIATAATCFMDSDEDLRTPMEQWSRRSPIPPRALRASFRAVEHAPWSIWTLVSQEPGGGGGGWRLQDLVGIAPIFVPDAPVRLEGGALVEPMPGDAVAARMVPTTAGWVAAMAIVVRGSPSRALVKRWRDAELLRRRPRELEAMLRSDGHVLARRLCEWHWLRTH
jgi:hypothetical protein